MALLERVWLEFVTLPFLIVMSGALAFRFGVTAEANRRFFELVLSTTIAAFVELLSEFNPGHIFLKRAYYIAMNINAWCLLRYVSAYVNASRSAVRILNNYLLYVCALMPLMLHDNNSLFSVLNFTSAVIFIIQAFGLQIIFQKRYRSEEFLLMNFSFVLLLDAFILQFIFDIGIQIVYTAATVFLFFTFFYLEAPAHRSIINTQRATKIARRITEEAIERANKSSQAKSDFLATTSHEIRTPMNAILGMNEMIINETNDPETKKHAIDIRNAGNHLLNIINNILDISKIEAGKMEIFNSDYHLGSLIRECENYIFHLLRSKPIKFHSDIPQDLPEHLHGDSVRIKQILQNLLENAAKYTKSGKIILSINYKLEPHNVVALDISVEDTGIGIRDEELPLLFEPFSRVNLNETRNILGAGLGLTLIRNVIHIMGGKIDVKSKYGEGSVFTVKLKQKKAESGEDLTLAEYDSRFLEFENDIAGDVGEFKCPGARILVVDDTPVNLVVAKGMLKKSEAIIDTAESGEDALNLMKWHKYDIVFLDHLMPGLDGIETLDRAKRSNPDTVYIALTANAGSNSRATYLGYGFNDYLPKPFEQSEINALLRKFIRE